MNESGADRGSLGLLLGGDAMLGRGVHETIQRLGPDYPLERVKPIREACGADLFLANLECAISRTPRKFSGPPKTFYFQTDLGGAEALRRAGVDAVSLANNHALDADYEGLGDTLDVLTRWRMPHAGAGSDLVGAKRAAVLEAVGRRIGLLSWCDHEAPFAATDERAGIWHVDLRDGGAVDELIGETRQTARHMDHTIVACHWQPNWVPRVHRRHRELGRRLVEAGADVVWGHSPHHLQGVERVGGGVVLYSTGGLVDDYAVDPHYHNDRSALFEVRLGQRGVTAVRARPIELRFARTMPAEGEVWDWVADWLSDCCREVGTDIEREGEWLRVI